MTVQLYVCTVFRTMTRATQAWSTPIREDAVMTADTRNADRPQPDAVIQQIADYVVV